MARLPQNLLVEVTEVSQTFDLGDITGVDLSESNDLKNRIGQAFIDKIVSRSKSGVDLYGNAFAAYAESYKKSDVFEAFGKSDNVNMTLTDNMNSSLDIVENSGNNIKLGWNDSLNNAKAYNHMVGDTVKKRLHFGLRKSDVSEVLADFKKEIGDLKKTQQPSDILSSLAVTAITGENESIIINIGDFFG